MNIPGEFQNYIIMYTLLGNGNSTNLSLITNDPDMTVFNLTGLEEYDRYSVVVYGETDAGVGPASDSIEVLTDEGREYICSFSITIIIIP